MNVQFGQAAMASRAIDKDPFFSMPRSKEHVRLRLFALLIALDAASIFGGFAIGNAIRYGRPFEPQGLTVAAVMTTIFVGVAVNSRAYNSELLAHWRRSVVPTLIALATAGTALLLFSYGLKTSENISRGLFAASVGAAAMLLTLFRVVLERPMQQLLGGSPLSQVLIRDGVDHDCSDAVHAVDAASAGLRPDIADPMMLDRLGRFLKGADSVVIACPAERRGAWAMALKGANIRGEILTPEVDEIGVIGTGRFAGTPTVVVSSGALGTRNRILKRGLDLTLALVALVALGPLMLFTALAIRLDGKGPILFVQQRLGRGNRLFAMYKFRSMRTELCDEVGARSASRDDERITRVGRFIRATSLDELPQLLNILKGDMSFVGPRPHALGSLAGDQLFWEVDQRYWHRHACKPGLTGLAQVRGFRGATHRATDLTARLQADLEYVNDWTLWRDLAILARTVTVVVHRNAY